MKVYLNGETRELPVKSNLSEMLRHLSLPSERIAIEINKEVVRRKDWANREINDGDRIEVIHFVGGG